MLELGLPADSADFHYIGRIENCSYHNRGKTISEIQSMAGNSMSSPCWSVGRLIEIFDICASEYMNGIKIPRNHIILDKVLIEFLGVLQRGDMDFSKLEE